MQYQGYDWSNSTIETPIFSKQFSSDLFLLFGGVKINPYDILKER